MSNSRHARVGISPLKLEVDAAAFGVVDRQLQMIRRRQVDAERVLEELRQHEEVLERFRLRLQHLPIFEPAVSAAPQRRFDFRAR